MKTLRLKAIWFIPAIMAIAFYSCKNEPSTSTENQNAGLDLTEVRKSIEAIDQQFSMAFKNGDSIAIASHYASDGSLGSIKGHENLVNAWGQMIRNAVKNGQPNVEYTINSLSTDGEFIAEMGNYEYKDNDGNVKSKGKYLVVWKLENSQWKIYKDMVL